MQFRIIVVAGFVKENSWPELVHELRSIIENSDLISEGANFQWKTVNALTVLQTIIKPFQVCIFVRCMFLFCLITVKFYSKDKRNKRG